MVANKTMPKVFWNDSVIDIWNDLQPQQTFYPFSSCYGGIITMIVFTIIHYIMDVVLYNKAASYADKEVKGLTEPKWIKKSKYASSLTYKKLSIIPSKKFGKKVIKKYELESSAQQQELISYQKQCNTYSKHISKYLEAAFKVIVFGSVYFYGLGLIYVDGQWFWDQKWMWAQGKLQHPGTNKYFNLDIYYYLQIGYHGHRAIYQFFEHSRRDFWAMV